MLPSFKILHPTSVSEASRELGRLGESARLYAGGAELLVLLRHRLIQADSLVDIKAIPDLNRLSWDGGRLLIGACVTHQRLATEPFVCRELPMLAYAESRVANIRVRNQGTLGGNLCFADPHSDPGTALLIYEATATVARGGESRRLPLADFLVGMYATALEPDELLTGIEVAPLPVGWTASYLRIHRFQRPTLGVAAAATLRDGRIIEGVRLAVGCVGPRPERLRELEAKIHDATMDGARRLIAEGKPYLRELLQPVGDLLGSADYKLYLTGALLSRALEEAVKIKDEGLKDEGKKSFEFRVSTSEGKATKKDEGKGTSLTVNGKPWSGEVAAEETLLEFLRSRLGLKGTKRSCESQVCGACTVLVDHRPVSSCSFLAFEADGRSVLTIEGLAQGEELDPLQEAFIRHVGAQCGYCTPGQIMAAKALLLENPSPARAEIAEWLEGNICRCGAYPAIVTAVLEAARNGGKSQA